MTTMRPCVWRHHRNRAIPDEPEVLDSGSKWKEEDSVENKDDGDPQVEERLKARRGRVHPEPPVVLPCSISPRLRDVLAQPRRLIETASRSEDGEPSPDPPLHALQGRPVW